MDAKQNISSIRHFLKKRHLVSDVFAGMCLQLLVIPLTPLFSLNSKSPILEQRSFQFLSFFHIWPLSGRPSKKIGSNDHHVVIFCGPKNDQKRAEKSFAKFFGKVIRQIFWKKNVPKFACLTF